jgi:hypothetical protein
LWYHRGHADLIEQRGEVAAFAMEKSGGQLGFGVFSFAEPSAALDFCENEISIADNLLQKTAKTARRTMRFPTLPIALCIL